MHEESSLGWWMDGDLRVRTRAEVDAELARSSAAEYELSNGHARSGRKHGQGEAVVLRAHRHRDSVSYLLTVPVSVMRQLPEHTLGRLFTCELTPEGILFRPADEKPEPPKWA